MENFELKGLIDVLKKDGVKAGEDEASKIIETAKLEAELILKDAKSQAADISAKAKKDAQIEKENLEKQLRLMARDFFLKVKQELTEILAIKPMKDAFQKELDNPAFLRQLIQKMVIEYTQADISSERRRIEVVIPAEMEKQFVHEWHQVMHQEIGVTPSLHLEKGLKGFKIAVEGRGQVVIDDEALLEAVRPYLVEKFRVYLG